MKKQLLFGALLFGSLFTAGAQTLMNENFNGLAVGNVATDITGATPGQGFYYLQTTNGAATTTSTNASATNAQIVETLGNKSLLLTGPNGNGGGRFLWKDGLDAAWTARTAGNNIIEVEFDINPGGTSTSRNLFGIYIYNAAGQILAGAVVRSATKEVSLAAYSTPTGSPVGNYTYALAAPPGIQLTENQVSRIGFSYNTTTGVARIKGPGIPTAGLTVQGSAVGTTPAEMDIVSFSGSTTANVNLVAGTMTIDNVTSKATATDSLLGAEDIAVSTAQFLVFPNPVTDVINVTNADNVLVNSVSIVDINGRTVKTAKFDAVSEAQVNIADLSAGVYMMTVSSDKGTMTKKIVKQ